MFIDLKQFLFLSVDWYTAGVYFHDYYYHCISALHRRSNQNTPNRLIPSCRPFVRPSAHASIRPSLRPYIRLSIPSSDASMHLSVRASMHLSVRPSIYFSIRPAAYISIHLFLLSRATAQPTFLFIPPSFPFIQRYRTSFWRRDAESNSFIQWKCRKRLFFINLPIPFCEQSSKFFVFTASNKIQFLTSIFQIKAVYWINSITIAQSYCLCWQKKQRQR